MAKITVQISGDRLPYNIAHLKNSYFIIIIIIISVDCTFVESVTNNYQ